MDRWSVHTYASMALAQGETVLTIGRLLGHRDPAMTLKYTHLSDAMVRARRPTSSAPCWRVRGWLRRGGD